MADLGLDPNNMPSMEDMQKQMKAMESQLPNFKSVFNHLFRHKHPTMGLGVLFLLYKPRSPDHANRL